MQDRAELLYKSLEKSISSTTEDRFNAYRRLKSLNAASLKSITFSSTALIIISILQISKINTCTISDKTNDLLSLALAAIPIIILVLSIARANCNYGIKSSQMHECGLLLNDLKRRIQPAIILEEFNEGKYKEFAFQYNEILTKYENHEDLDRRIRRIESRTKNQCPLMYFLIQTLKGTFLYGPEMLAYKFITLASTLFPIFLIINTCKIS